MSQPRILMGCFGSLGEVLPFARLCREVVQYGYTPVVLAQKSMKDHFAIGGAEFFPLDLSEAMGRSGSPFEGKGGWENLISNYIEPCLQSVIEQSIDVIDRTSPSLVMASWILPGLHLAAFERNVPAVRVCLNPHASMPVSGGLVFDPQRDFESYLRTLVMPRLDKACSQFSFIRNGVHFLFPDSSLDLPRILLFPKAFGPLPIGNACYLADYGHATDAKMTEELNRFLDMGAPPVLICLGSFASRDNIELIERLRLAAFSNGYRVIIATSRGRMPPVVKRRTMVASGLPIRTLLPKVAGVVHHAGNGISMETMTAGLPAIVIPLAYDQFDKAGRLEALGVAIRAGRDSNMNTLVDCFQQAFSATSAVRDNARQWVDGQLFSGALSLPQVLERQGLKRSQLHLRGCL